MGRTLHPTRAGSSRSPPRPTKAPRRQTRPTGVTRVPCRSLALTDTPQNRPPLGDLSARPTLARGSGIGDISRQGNTPVDSGTCEGSTQIQRSPRTRIRRLFPTASWSRTGATTRTAPGSILPIISFRRSRRGSKARLRKRTDTNGARIRRRCLFYDIHDVILTARCYNEVFLNAEIKYK